MIDEVEDPEASVARVEEEFPMSNRELEEVVVKVTFKLKGGELLEGVMTTLVTVLLVGTLVVGVALVVSFRDDEAVVVRRLGGVRLLDCAFVVTTFVTLEMVEMFPVELAKVAANEEFGGCRVMDVIVAETLECVISDILGLRVLVFVGVEKGGNSEDNVDD